jgi:hypothetical protein
VYGIFALQKILGIRRVPHLFFILYHIRHRVSAKKIPQGKIFGQESTAELTPKNGRGLRFAAFAESFNPP